MRYLSVSLCSVVAIMLANVAVAQEDEMRRWVSDEFGDAQFSARYGTFAYFDQPVDNQRTDFHMVKHELDVSWPLYQDEQREWTMILDLDAIDSDTGAVLVDDDFPWDVDPFPAELYNIQLGTGYRQKLDNGWSAGGVLLVGSPSDKPFASGDEITVNATAYLRIPDGERNAWLFFLNYFNNREFLPNVPIPGVGYQYNPTPQFEALIGIPFAQFYWQPMPKLSLTGRYLVPRQIDLQAAYELLEPLEVYVGYQWDNDRFLRSDREDDDERLFYYDQRVLAGVKWDINESTWVDFSGGWAFDRFWFEGEGYDERDHSRIEIDDGPFVRLQLGLQL